MAQSSTDTLVIGAGPYGLSVAAHLRAAGVDHKILGPPMDAWNRMPRGMFLRSAVSASSLSAPARKLKIDDYFREQGMTPRYPVPLETFLAYSRWFVERAEIDVDQRLVSSLAADNGGFRAVLEDGEEITAARVVVAAGTKPLKWIPPQFRELGPELVSHAGDHSDLSVFAGKRLVVVGAGQSAIEFAAIAHEEGADVRVLFRAPSVHWLTRSARLHTAWLLGKLLYSPNDVGPAGLSRVVSLPGAFRRLPMELRRKATARCVRPAASAWLVERMREVPLDPGRTVREATEHSGRVRLDCSEQGVVEADHVLLATGYQVDLARYGLIAPDLLAAIQSVGGFPALGPGFESSVDKLHIVGWPASGTFGPAMRFVCGADFAARALTRAAVPARRRAPARVPTAHVAG